MQTQNNTLHRAAVITPDTIWYGNGVALPAKGDISTSLLLLLEGTMGRFTQHSTIVVDGVTPARVQPQGYAVRLAGWDHSKIEAWTLFHRLDGRTVAVGLRDAMTTPHLGVLFDKATDPGVLALHLDRYAQATGTPWRGTCATSAHNAIRLSWGNKSYQPLWQHARIPVRSGVGFISWSRPLTETEQRWGHVYTFDANNAYLGSAVSADLAWSQLHHTGPQPFDKTLPGYWHIDLPTDLLAALADPARPPLLPTPRKGQVWVTTPYLRFLEDLGYQCLIVDSWTGRAELRDNGHRLHPAASRILRTWGETVRDGLPPKGTPVGTAVRRTYKDAVGGFQKEGMRIARRDWGETIIDLWRATLLTRVHRIHQEHGVWPVRVATDSISYAAGEGLQAQMAAAIGCRPGLGGFHPEPGYTVTVGEWLDRFPVTQGARRPKRRVTS